MCDYSLELYRSRPATAGETVTLHRFPSGTMGFTAPHDCETATCILPGATLQLEGISEAVQRVYKVGQTEKVTMTRMEGGTHVHRDAVKFENGREVLLQSLNAGLTAKQIPAAADYTEQVQGLTASLATGDAAVDTVVQDREPALV